MKNIIFFVAIALLLTACKNCGDERNPLTNLKEAEKGDLRYYGGTFIYNEVENFKSLYPLNVTEVISQRITTQVYEGLVRFDQQDLSIQPALATEWEVDSTGTRYTFKLREGVRFHDDPCFEDGEGREVTAYDFKYCFDKICEAASNNQSFWIFKDKVVGADKYYHSTVKGDPLEGGVAGVRVLDDYTLQIELLRPFASFINVLAMPNAAVFPKEAVEAYGMKMRVKTVGTGPFYISELQEDEAVVLQRNSRYWGEDEFGNPLPYLDAIKVSFIKESKSALLEFRKQKLDMKHKLPVEMLEEIVDGMELTAAYSAYQLQQSPVLSIHYYGFQHQKEPFSNKLVRQAFNYAVDKRKLVDYTLKEVGIQGIYGVVPPALVGYEAKAIQGYSFDPDKATKLMKEAGYPNGEGFPEITLQINAGGGRNIQVAEAIQKMLSENLNISVNVQVLPWSQHLERIESGETSFWRIGWQADYPDPENFLNLFYGKHAPKSIDEKAYLNRVRYRNADYDTLLSRALRTLDEERRNMLYLHADQKAIDDAVVMPLYYEQAYRLLQPYVRNMPQNPMEYRSFREVYFTPEKEA